MRCFWCQRRGGLHGLPHLSRLDVVAPLPLVLGLSLSRLETLSLSGVDGGMGGAIPAATPQLGYSPPPPGTDTALPPLPLFPALRHVSAEVGTLLLDAPLNVQCPGALQPSNLHPSPFMHSSL